jgi:hypothetical protein
MYLQRKNHRCNFIQSVLFCSKIITRYTLCVRFTLCAGGPSLGAKPGLAEDFPSKVFPITTPGNGNVGMVLVAFEYQVLSYRKFAIPEKKRQRNFGKRKPLFGDMITFCF